MISKWTHFFTALAGLWIFVYSMGTSPYLHAGVNRGVKAFTENRGQVKDQYGNFRQDIDFKLAGMHTNVFVGKGKILYQWMEPRIKAVQEDARALLLPPGGRMPVVEWHMNRMEMNLQGYNPGALVEKEAKVAYTERYYGPITEQEGALISGYRKVIYKDIYPSIDWVIYIKDQGIEYDFIVREGGKVGDIRMAYSGADRLLLEQDGSLTVKCPAGIISEKAPYTFQQDGHIVASRFHLEGNQVAFVTANYEGTLTIDPKVQWGTYIGGSNIFDEVNTSYGDAKGNVYIVGQTTSASNIATTGAYQMNILGLVDAYMMKFDAKGVALWGTYYGGNGLDRGQAVTGDTTGHVYMVFISPEPSGLATAGTHQTVNGGGIDAVIAKFDENGKRVWATYYGGAEDDSPFNMVSDGQYLYIGGQTPSADKIATPGAFQVSAGGGARDLDMFLTKFTVDGQQVWGTYYGGMENDHWGYCALDKEGNVYLSGMTIGSAGLATTGSYQANRAGDYDGVLAKFNKDGVRLWATYYGGTGEEWVSSVTCDKEGNAYMAGMTKSAAGIATANSYQSQIGSTTAPDNFIVKFNKEGQRQWATYYGGAEEEGTNAYLGIMGEKDLIMTSATMSFSGIATADAIQPNYVGGNEIYIARFSLDGQRQWASYLGDGGEELNGRPSISGSNLYVNGASSSPTGIATPGSYIDTYPLPLLYSGMLVKYCFSVLPETGMIRGRDSICPSAIQEYQLAWQDDIDGCIWDLPEGWLGNSDSFRIDVTAGAESGIISVRMIRCGDTSDASTFPVYVYPTENPVITVDGFTLGTATSYESYQWLFNDQLIPGADKDKLVVSENGHYRVIVTNSYGCTDTSDAYEVTNVGLNQQKTLGGQYRIYPNPAQRVLYVQTAEPLHLIISSIDGKHMLQGYGREINIEALPPGSYFILLKNKQGQFRYAERWVKY